MQERHQSAAAVREARGMTLLNEWLFPEQKAQFALFRYFDVVGSPTGKKYRISLGRGTNVQEVDETGRPLMGWCFVPSGDLVPGDIVLAQKVALETDECRALAVANRFPVHVPCQVATYGRDALRSGLKLLHGKAVEMQLRQLRQPNQNGQSKKDWPFALLSILDDHLTIGLALVFFYDNLLTWLFSLLDDGRGVAVPIIVPVAFANGYTSTHRSHADAYANFFSVSGYRDRDGCYRRKCDCIRSNHVSLHKISALTV
jgi:hypothetical protein